MLYVPNEKMDCVLIYLPLYSRTLGMGMRCERDSASATRTHTVPNEDELGTYNNNNASAFYCVPR